MTGEPLVLVGARQIAHDQLAADLLRERVIEHGAGQHQAVGLPRYRRRRRACECGDGEMIGLLAHRPNDHDTKYGVCECVVLLRLMLLCVCVFMCAVYAFGFGSPPRLLESV